MDDGVYLKFFLVEGRQHAGQPLHQWLLREASRLGLPGGSAFRAVAGFGRHHRLHEAHFYELAGELPMEVVFVAPKDDAERLVAAAATAGLSLVYCMLPVHAGTTGDD